MQAGAPDHCGPSTAAAPLARRAPRGAHILLALATIVICLAWAHGQRLIEGWSKTDGEHKNFVIYDKYHIAGIGDCFSKKGFFPGLYRPLSTNLYYHLGGKLFGDHIEGYHAINLALIILNALLLYYLAALFLAPYTALIPAALFVSRLSHVEIMINTCEFQSLLATFFSLLALILFFRGRSRGQCLPELAALPCLVLAFLSKESAVSASAILIAFGLLFDRRRGFRHYLLPLALTAAWAVLFIFVFRDLSEGTATGFKYNFAPAHMLKNLTAYLLSFSNLLVAPLDDWRMAARITALKESPGVLVAVAAGLAALVIFLPARLFSRSGRQPNLRAAALGLAIFVAGVLPFIIFDNRLFMRYGYFGHLGLALALGAGAQALIAPLIVRARLACSRRRRGSGLIT